MNRDMKNLSVRCGVLLMLAFAAAGCVNEDPGFGESENLGTTATGFLTFSDVHVVVDSEIDQNTEESPTRAMLSRADDASSPTGATRGKEAASLNDYRIVIEGRKNGVVRDATYGVLKNEMGDKGLEVPVDTYTITATSHTPAGSMLPDDVQSNPSYGGEKRSVTVSKEQTTPVGTIYCKLQNIKITLSVSADLYDQLDVLDGSGLSDVVAGQKIKAAIYCDGNKSVRWDVPADWNWETTDKELVPPVYFPALNPDGFNTLHLSFTAKLNGGLIPMDKDITEIMKGQWRRIHVVLQYDTTGNLTFDAQVSSFVQDETIEIKGDGSMAGITWSELPYEDPSTFGPSIRWADGTEVPEVPEPIVLDGGALQNIVLRAPNGIQKVALAYSTTNADMDYSGLLNIEDLCASKGNPTLKSFGIPYGADLAGRTEAVFELNKLAEQIGAYDGEYTFTFTVIDGKGQPYTRTLKFISGGGSGTPPQVIWADGTLYDDDGFNADGTEKPEAKYVVMNDEMKIDIELKAFPNFRSIAVVITSDALDASTLALAHLPTSFDLCHLQDFEYNGILHTAAQQAYQLRDNLKLIGVVNDDLKAKNEASFSITGFISMMNILGADAKFQFKLTVVDSQGRSTTKYLRLQNPAE